MHDVIGFEDVNDDMVELLESELWCMILSFLTRIPYFEVRLIYVAECFTLKAGQYLEASGRIRMFNAFKDMED